MTPEQLQDFKERLEKAAQTLLDMQMAADANGWDERSAHLRSKREGVRLALSYLNEYQQGAQ